MAVSTPTPPRPIGVGLVTILGPLWAGEESREGNMTNVAGGCQWRDPIPCRWSTGTPAHLSLSHVPESHGKLLPACRPGEMGGCEIHERGAGMVQFIGPDTSGFLFGVRYTTFPGDQVLWGASDCARLPRRPRSNPARLSVRHREPHAMAQQARGIARLASEREMVRQGRLIQSPASR
jgi:hypothetical protein